MGKTIGPLPTLKRIKPDNWPKKSACSGKSTRRMVGKGVHVSTCLHCSFVTLSKSWLLFVSVFWAKRLKAFLKASLLVWGKGETEAEISRYVLQRSVFRVRLAQPRCLSVERRRAGFVCKKTLQIDSIITAKFWPFSPRIPCELLREEGTSHGSTQCRED